MAYEQLGNLQSGAYPVSAGKGHSLSNSPSFSFTTPALFPLRRLAFPPLALILTFTSRHLPSLSSFIPTDEL